MIQRSLTFAQLIIGVSALAVVGACAVRFCYLPSFWLDEAFVAVSLRHPTAETIFAPLRYGQYFPRVYLGAIAVLRELLGYEIWVLRLLPTLSFVVATVLWARLLGRRSGAHVALAALGGALFVGSSFWLDQSIQLKQYTLDVLVALIPFSLGDEFFKEALIDGKRKLRLALLATPCVISYTYPIALGARVLGWYAQHGRRRGRRLTAKGSLALVASVAIGLAVIWISDHRFNITNRESYLAYWRGSILSSRFQEGLGSGLSLIANFLWGWHHGRLMPIVVAAVAPLQAIGVYRVLRRWKNCGASCDDHWGSRSLGSLLLLVGTILGSLILSYPIRAGRLALFAQVHTQILAVEGGLLIESLSAHRKVLIGFLYASIAIVMVYSGHRYLDFIRSEPVEDIRPMLSLIKPEMTNTLYVHPCSVAQVESLPEPLPVEHIELAGKRQLPTPGETTWVLWTNLSDDYCREWLDDARNRALSWQVVHEAPGRGLVLAKF
ncbi:MAG TPA: hypothetical protein VLM38_09420 [Blastocatellia bacterium]|nr:hypothetical protein [Blastocatellia bacterium]